MNKGFFKISSPVIKHFCVIEGINNTDEFALARNEKNPSQLFHDYSSTLLEIYQRNMGTGDLN